MIYTVVFSQAAEDDLFAIYDFIAAQAGNDIAAGFVGRIETYCLGFADTPERGRRRDDLRPGMRSVGFRRRATILFAIDSAKREAVIQGVYYGGRSFENKADDDLDQ